MTEIDFHFDRSIEQNAEAYYERAKKAKQKKAGAEEALKETKRKLEALQRQKEQAMERLEKEQQQRRTKRKKEWYEKFHWFFTSDGYLCIGGRDATTNEIIIKKHTSINDLVFHTDLAGAPFFVIKNGQQASEKSYYEAAQATAAYSKAWKQGFSTLEVFYARPEQVSKEAQAGEFMGKGAFMVYGKTTYLHPHIEIAIGITHEQRVVGGPVEAIKTQAERVVHIIPGKKKTSDVAKQVQKLLDNGATSDEVMPFIPSGGAMVRTGE